MKMDDHHKALTTSATPLLMYTPTLPKFNVSSDDQDHSQSHPRRPTLSDVVQEIKQVYILATHMIITGLLIYGKSVISMLFMGRLGKEALAGGSLSTGIANITGYSIISGLAMGMEAISSQAHGAKQWQVMYQTLQRTVTILVIASMPISVLWLNIKPILLFCGQDPTISSIASTYLAFSLPDLLFQSFINPLKIYLRTQNITLPLILSAALALALHAPINYFLVHRLGLGIRGIAMAAAITDLNLLITLLLYLCFSGICRKSWQQCDSIVCFNDWKTLIGLAVPSCVSVCLEWWWYELMIVLSGLLPNAAEAVATMGILLQATSFVYIFPSSLSLAVSTRVGNELGANQPGKARTSSLIALSCAAFNGLVAMVFMVTMRNAWGRGFSSDEAILGLTVAAMPVAGLCELGNCPQTAGCGVLRGSARPTTAANINLGAFYGVGLPIAVVMGLVMNMGLPGLWLGLLAAQVVCAALMVIVLMRTDWVQQANRGRELIGIDEDQEAQKKTLQ
ncbi:Protein DETOXIFICATION 48 [Camellia lanceoleosa]|uniref:Protein DETOXIFICATION 48 n=1 Tax=Camellia lanceoleosa TaxID=1840588 RepID=A0ACC0J2J7_9ERIC|nr:Protein DETOXIFICATION 48 [Camellia lanceoleosa]